MIPLSTFNLLLVADVLLVLYSIIDTSNRFYANIMTAFLSSVLGVYLSLMMFIGAIQYGDGTVIQDTSAAVIILVFAIAMMIYSALMIYDAYEEYQTVEAESA